MSILLFPLADWRKRDEGHSGQSTTDSLLFFRLAQLQLWFVCPTHPSTVAHFDPPICLETDVVLSLVFLLSAASRCSLVRVGRGDEASLSQTPDFVFVVVFFFSSLFPSSSLSHFHASGIILELPSRTRCLAIILLIILRLIRRDPRCLCPFSSPLPDFPLRDRF